MNTKNDHVTFAMVKTTLFLELVEKKIIMHHSAAISLIFHS